MVRQTIFPLSALLVALLFVASMLPHQAAAQSSSTTVTSSAELSLTSLRAFKKRGKRKASKKQVQALRKKLTQAIKKAKKLQKKFPDNEDIDSVIQSLLSAKKSAKRVSGKVRSIIKNVKQTTKLIIKALKSDDPDFDSIVSSAESLERTVENGGSSKSGSTPLTGLPTVEEVFTTLQASFPSTISRLPNINGVTTDAFSTQELFYEDEDDFTGIATGISQQPTSNQCLAFRPETDSEVAGYEGCRAASSLVSPIYHIARASWDLCTASLAITNETFGSGVTRTFGSTKPNKIYTKAGTTQLNLSNGRKIFVQVEDSDSLDLQVSVWSCGADDTTAERYAVATLDSDLEVSISYAGSIDDDVLEASLDYGVEEGEDGELTPTENAIAIVKLSRNGDTTVSFLDFQQDGFGDAMQNALFADGTSEYRFVSSEMYLTGFDRIRMDGIASEYNYNEQSSTETGYKFGTRSYVVSAEDASLLDGFENKTTAQALLDEGIPSLNPDTSSYSCSPDNVTDVFSIDLTQEKVSNALLPCDEIPSAHDFCRDDSEIADAALDFHTSCTD